jgi:TRAP-type C4-dicarboxylate transport system substrate-binding protein
VPNCSVMAVAAALALGASACGGSGEDKAGGEQRQVERPVGKPVVLTLLSVDELWASEFAAAVARLSGGAIRIEVSLNGEALIDYERRLVEDVRAGEVDMASVGARAWDRLDVTSLRALVAPMLVDSLELQRRVLESPMVERMLAGVEPLGLVGLAVLPGPLRRPFGVSRRLVGPQDYQGATIGYRYGGVARATLEAFGARPKGYRLGSLAGLDGVEFDLSTIARKRYDEDRGLLTANVVLWSRPETIVIRRDAFDRLPSSQRQILRRAGREALAPVLARLVAEEHQALESTCARGRVTLVTASPSQLSALRAAIQPVTEELQRDVQTREFLGEIRKLRRAEAADEQSLRCPAPHGGSSELDGVWESNVTRAAMVANGASAPEAATYDGSGTLELKRGRWTFHGERATVTGAYVVTGDDLRLTMLSCTANPCSPGAATEYRWSVYRDALSLTPRSGLPFWPRLVAKPSRRVG